MKIKSVRLERYKRFVDTTFDFVDEDTGKPYDLIVLVGENGCGKSSILQAIAAILGEATGQLHQARDLNWPGFVIDTIDANRSGKSRITLDIVFKKDELEATQEYYNKADIAHYLRQYDIDLFLDENIKLHFYHDTSQVYEGYVIRAGETSELPDQFKGRGYASSLIVKRIASHDILKRVGGVFWYHELRNESTLTPHYDNGWDDEEESFDKKIAKNALNAIRELFTGWFAEENKSRVTKFNKIYQQFFPDRTLSRIESYTYSRAMSRPIYFKTLNDNFEYELAELSGGERALLPIIIDFVQWDINNSVILIDELELHLHPPLQRALIYNLQNLGNNNQFIITTHSDYVANMVRAIPRSKLIRVDNV